MQASRGSLALVDKQMSQPIITHIHMDVCVYMYMDGSRSPQLSIYVALSQVWQVSLVIPKKTEGAGGLNLNAAPGFLLILGLLVLGCSTSPSRSQRFTGSKEINFEFHLKSKIED